MSKERVDSFTLEDDELVAIHHQTCCSDFQSRSKSDRCQVVLIGTLALLSIFIASVSHSRDLVQIEPVAQSANRAISCKTFGWFYQSDCKENSGVKTMLLTLDEDLGVSGVAFGVAHLIEGVAFALVAISLTCYNPQRPIRCFRSACALVILTMFTFVSSLDIFLILNLATLSAFAKVTPLWVLFVSMSNVTLIFVALMCGFYGWFRNQDCELGEFEDFEKVQSERASKSEVKTLSLEDLEEWERGTGRRFSISMSPPTHRRGSSAFTAILGLTPLARVLSPNGQGAYTFQENSVSSGECSPLFDELNEITPSDVEFGATPRSMWDDTFEIRRIETWSVKDVVEWVQLGLEEPQIADLLKASGVDGKAFLCLIRDGTTLIGLDDRMREKLENGLSDLLKSVDDEMDPRIESSMIEYPTPSPRT